MNINLDFSQRSTLGELVRRESTRMRVAITTKSDGADTSEITERTVYLENLANALMTSFEPDKSVATVPVRAEEG